MHPRLFQVNPEPMIHPDEVSDIALFFASDEARAIRGRTIEATAGQSFIEA